MKSLGLMVLERTFYVVLPIVSIWDLITSRMGPFFPRDMIGRIYAELHITLLHTNIQALGLEAEVKKEDFFTYFPL